MGFRAYDKQGRISMIVAMTSFSNYKVLIYDWYHSGNNNLHGRRVIYGFKNEGDANSYLTNKATKKGNLITTEKLTKDQVISKFKQADQYLKIKNKS